MVNEYILSLDTGTSGIKVSLFDRRGVEHYNNYLEYDTFYPAENMVEQSPYDWWGSFCKITKNIFSETNVQPSDIVCVAPSGQMAAVIPIDEEGSLIIDPCMIWADLRADKEVDEVFDRIGGFEEFYRITGVAYNPATYSAFKIKWLKKNKPKIFYKAYKFLLSSKEFISYKLTHRIATDYSDASHTGFLDCSTKHWSKEILSAVELDINRLPNIRYASEVLGSVTREAAKETGLFESTPVCVGGGDVAIAAAGATSHKRKSCFIVLGSGFGVSIYLDKPVFNFQARLSNTRAVDGNGFVIEQGDFGGGITYRWIRDIINIPELGISPPSFQDIDKLAEKVGVGANGLLFNSNLRIGGTLYQDSNLRGMFIGLSLNHTYADMCRAVLEGVALNIRLSIEHLVKNGIEIEEIYIVGGGSNSGLWRQIIADVIHRPICLLNVNQNVNTWGAAMCAGIAIGWYEDYESYQMLNKVKEITKPSRKYSLFYDKLYEVFLTSNYAMLPSFNKLAGCRKLLDKIS